MCALFSDCFDLSIIRLEAKGGTPPNLRGQGSTPRISTSTPLIRGVWADRDAILCLFWHGRCFVNFVVGQVNVQMDVLLSCKFLLLHVCLNNATMEDCCPVASLDLLQSFA